MMIVICNQCSTKFKLDERLVKKPSFAARCSRCRNVFTAYRPVRVQEVNFLNLSTALNCQGIENVISVSNQKGGVAKTSTCLNLGAAFARLNKKVLLIDLDVQANLTLSLGYQNTPSFYDALNSGAGDLSPFIIRTKYPNLSLLPSNSNMVLLNKKFFGADNFEYILRDRLNPIKDRFDYILVDTPPSIEFFTLNALTASKLVIVPSQCEYLSTHGVHQIVKMINLIRKKTNPQIDPMLLLTMYEADSTVAQTISSKLKNVYGNQMFDTVIERDCKIKEAQILNMPVMHYDNASRSSAQYMRLAKEIINGSVVRCPLQRNH